MTVIQIKTKDDQLKEAEERFFDAAEKLAVALDNFKAAEAEYEKLMNEGAKDKSISNRH